MDEIRKKCIGCVKAYSKLVTGMLKGKDFENQYKRYRELTGDYAKSLSPLYRQHLKQQLKGLENAIIRNDLVEVSNKIALTIEAVIASAKGMTGIRLPNSVLINLAACEGEQYQRTRQIEQTLDKEVRDCYERQKRIEENGISGFV
ncbi:MAG: hypothetical protein V1837_04860 [Candidatus Woesearchaeota archaeon]